MRVAPLAVADESIPEIAVPYPLTQAVLLCENSIPDSDLANHVGLAINSTRIVTYIASNADVLRRSGDSTRPDDAVSCTQAVSCTHDLYQSCQANLFSAPSLNKYDHCGKSENKGLHR